jgi:hypothetical protein
MELICIDSVDVLYPEAAEMKGFDASSARNGVQF